VANYQLKSRRPIADAFRRTARPAVALCLALNIHPDVISYSSILASAAGGLCFFKSAQYPWLLILGPLFCYLRLFLNMLDGMVALAAGKASARGEIINDLPDRISDILIFTAVAQSNLCAPALGYLAAIFAILTAYVGLLGQAAGAGRQFAGIMSKPWRMVALNIGAWLTFLLLHTQSHSDRLGPATILDWTCILIIAGCIQTVTVRLRKIITTLNCKDQADKTREID